MIRRRPLARAAMVGGAAYYGGKKRAEGQMREEQQEQAIADLQAQQYAQAQAAQAAPAAPAAGGDDMVQQLENLKKLLDDGVLTQAEFDLQKQKILSGT